jgi:hypothetical protein
MNDVHARNFAIQEIDHILSMSQSFLNKGRIQVGVGFGLALATLMASLLFGSVVSMDCKVALFSTTGIGSVSSIACALLGRKNINRGIVKNYYLLNEINQALKANEDLCKLDSDGNTLLHRAVKAHLPLTICQGLSAAACVRDRFGERPYDYLKGENTPPMLNEEGAYDLQDLTTDLHLLKWANLSNSWEEIHARITDPSHAGSYH